MSKREVKQIDGTSEQAREMFGADLACFLADLAKSGRKYRIDAFCCLVMHKGFARVVSTGTDDEARAKAATVAMWLSEQVALLLGSEGNA